jgi:hypoxanthine phosphoribosyltransferase
MDQRDQPAGQNVSVDRLYSPGHPGPAPLELLVPEQAILVRVSSLADQINRDYAARQPMTLLAVLTGSFIFVADLCRRLTVPHRLGVVRASSYRGPQTRPSELRVEMNLVPDVHGRHVLLVDDILDTGQTLARLLTELRSLHPASLRTAVLLRKRGRQTVPLEPDYVGFEIPDVFVVGYGLDYNDDYRHLPYLAALPQPPQADASGGPVEPSSR